MPIANTTLNALQRGFDKYVTTLGDDIAESALSKLLDGVRSIANPRIDERGVEVGQNPATVRGGILDLIKRFENPQAIADELNLDFKISVATDVVRGADNFVKEGLDEDVVEAYPAWELLRVYDRDVPRGFRRGPKGTLIPMPGDDWESRWQAAGGELIDGRMIALKSDPIWQALGDGVGGYTDTLGNPFPPFAFNSGYDVENIGRVECIELGLLKPGEKAEAPDIDPLNIFKMEAAA